MNRPVVAIAVAIVIVVSVIGLNFFVPIGRFAPVDNVSGVLATVTGALPDPSVYSYFPTGYVTPSLWGLRSADGTTEMTVYQDGSVDFISNLKNVDVGGSIVGYPHVGFNATQYFPIKISALTTLTAYASFDLYRISPALLSVDFSYDFNIQSSPSLHKGVLYEVMIWEFWNAAYPVARLVGVVHIPASINGVEKEVTWLVFEAKYNGQSYPTVIFAPLNFNARSMSWEISIPEFVNSLQKVLKQNLSNDYIPELDVGSEFGTALFPNEICDWTLSYWYEIGNSRYNLLGQVSK